MAGLQQFDVGHQVGLVREASSYSIIFVLIIAVTNRGENHDAMSCPSAPAKNRAAIRTLEGIPCLQLCSQAPEGKVLVGEALQL